MFLVPPRRLIGSKTGRAPARRRFLMTLCWLRSVGPAGALWRVWSPERIPERRSRDHFERLRVKRPGDGCVYSVLRVVALGLLFSLHSAFHIGWRELNVGNWISRLQLREYTLRGTGWVRVVSGVQSLFSVYLLALWALTYFGRPFG
jgi:hypothetical protein